MAIKIEMHHFFHIDELPRDPAIGALASQVEKILHLVQGIKRTEVAIMLDLKELEAAALATEGAVETTKVIIDGAVTILNDILGQLQNTVDPAQVAAIVARGQASAAALTSARDKLAASVEQYSPPPPPPPVE